MGTAGDGYSFTVPANPRLDDFQRAHPWIGLPLAVIYKFVDDQGAYLSALITYYGFLSLLPMLLLGVSILGFVLHNDPGAQKAVVDSAVAQFPIIGKQLHNNIHGYHGSGAGLAIGIIGSLYGGLGVAQAGQNAMNTVWAVPRNDRPNPFKSRLRSFGLLATLGLGVLLTTAVTAASAELQVISGGGIADTLVRIAIWIVSALLNIGLFIAAFQLLTALDVKVRDVALGAVIAGVLWQVLQTLGTLYFAHIVDHEHEIYGLFGIVLGLITWIYIEALIVVLCAELNVVVRRRLWPRSLLTPFTDEVNLTSADREMYEAAAQAQRHKGFETIDVDFER